MWSTKPISLWWLTHQWNDLMYDLAPQELASTRIQDHRCRCSSTEKSKNKNRHLKIWCKAVSVGLFYDCNLGLMQQYLRRPTCYVNPSNGSRLFEHEQWMSRTSFIWIWIFMCTTILWIWYVWRIGLTTSITYMWGNWAYASSLLLD